MARQATEQGWAPAGRDVRRPDALLVLLQRAAQRDQMLLQGVDGGLGAVGQVHSLERLLATWVRTVGSLMTRSRAMS